MAPQKLWGGIAPDGEQIILIQRDGTHDMYVISHELELYTLPLEEITLTGRKYVFKEVDA